MKVFLTAEQLLSVYLEDKLARTYKLMQSSTVQMKSEMPHSQHEQTWKIHELHKYLLFSLSFDFRAFVLDYIILCHVGVIVPPPRS